jgi:nucleotide-binding universal stress UspA family protein
MVTTTTYPAKTATEMAGIASVLVLLDGDGRKRAGVCLAAEAARRQHAAFHAVYLETWPSGDRQGDAGACHGPARGAEKVARDAAEENGLALEWEVIAGDRACITRAVIDRALTADLIVVDRGTRLRSGANWAIELFAQLPLLSGRPILFVPERHRAESFGERVMVAWNGSRESSRAVNDALPFLELARDVTVLNVEAANENDRHPAETGSEPRLASYLSHHGIRVRLCKSYVADAGVGETIASRARESDTDLLVMGAHGYGRPGHVVLGSATRYLLDHMPVPVLMSY